VGTPTTIKEVVLVTKRLQTLGVVLAVIGLAFLTGAGVAYAKVQQGYDSLKALSAAQNVELTYNDNGELADGEGSTEEATAIMSLLADDWKYPVVESDLDPNDPVVNTASEYMYQMATVSFHVLHGEQTVVLDEDVTADDGKVYKAGTYQFAPEGRYWSGYDRSNPIEAAARGQAWTGTAHGLVAELGVGTVTHSALQLGLAIAGILAGLGLTIILAGLGLVWAGRAKVPTIAAAPIVERIREPVSV
jgi:hypothetical protein